MAHQTEIVINGVTTAVTEFDHTAQEIDDGIDNLHTLTGGATTPQAALANLGAGVRPKITINPFFEINQRGQNTYTTNGYTVDGWKMGTNIATLTVEDDGVSITLNQAISSDTRLLHQIIENPEQYVGKTLTFTFLIKSVTASGFRCGYRAVVNGSVKTSYKNITDAGIYEISWEVESGVTEILFNTLATSKISNGAKCSIIAGAVEVGDTQTLAYQDDTGAWQLLPQPESDYATQLLKCQRYQVVLPYVDSPAISNNGTSMYGIIPTPAPMRAIPAIENNGQFVLRGNGKTVSDLSATLYSTSASPNGIRVWFTGSFDANAPYMITTAGQIIFNANL